MNKLSTLVLVATLGLAAPAFAQSPADLRADPFLAKKETAVESAAPAKSDEKAAMPAKKSKHSKKAAKHHKKAHKAAADAAAPAADAKKEGK